AVTKKSTLIGVWRGFLLIPMAMALACFALSPMARAVSPPPDGDYPNGNTAEGGHALDNLTTGATNTAIGDFALQKNTTGSSNSAIGWGALSANTTAANNTANGNRALFENTTGANNTASGSSFSATT